MDVQIADVFTSDVFKMTTLTDAIKILPFKPSLIGSMGLFEEHGIGTTTIMIEEQDGSLVLIPTSPRGSPAIKMKSKKRRAHTFACAHIALEDDVLADDLLNVRQFGTNDLQAGAAQVVNDKLSVMRQSYEVTMEYHRLGAILGKVLDADGSTELYDLYDEFGITEAEIDFALDDEQTDVRAQCLQVARLMEQNSSGLPYNHIHCFCGKLFFDRLVNHPQCYEAYHFLWGQGTQGLANDYRKGFNFGGITFQEYPGTVSGVKFLADGKAKFFPVGMPGLFKSYFGPADFMEAVGTLGIPLYVKSAPIDNMNRGMSLHVQSNPITICTRPKLLITATEEEEGS